MSQLPDFIWHSLFTLATTTAAFYAGVKLTERHCSEKEYAVERAASLTRLRMESQALKPVELSEQKPSMAAPVPVPPPSYSRCEKALAPGGPVETRMNEVGQGTYLFHGKHAAN